MLTVEIPPTEHKIISYKDNTLIVEDDTSSDDVRPVSRGAIPARSASAPRAAVVMPKPSVLPRSASAQPGGKSGPPTPN
jgi:hypothetical protein